MNWYTPIVLPLAFLVVLGFTILYTVCYLIGLCADRIAYRASE